VEVKGKDKKPNNKLYGKPKPKKCMSPNIKFTNL